MEATACALICLSVSVFWSYGVTGQVSSLCRPQERFLSCGGCQKTCRDPKPLCDNGCRTGCYCNDDEVRNDTGHCVKLSECPPTTTSTERHLASWINTTKCPANEEFSICIPCIKTCDEPNPICPAQCSIGCQCIDDLVRDQDGKCVKYENCPSNLNKTDELTDKETRIKCGENQFFSMCVTCERTCSDPEPVCSHHCHRMCTCKHGYLRAPSERCVRKEHCPTAEVTQVDAHEFTIEDCGPDEVFLSCGWCEPSCSEPNPVCPQKLCTRGCLCRPPLLRHHSGHCVDERHCMAKKCIDPDEEYVCRYGCEPRCDRRRCISRPRYCSLGCHCKLGLLRDSRGKCVPPSDCQSINTTIIIT